jgi:hypothetical protein
MIAQVASEISLKNPEQECFQEWQLFSGVLFQEWELSQEYFQEWELSEP